VYLCVPLCLPVCEYLYLCASVRSKAAFVTCEHLLLSIPFIVVFVASFRYYRYFYCCSYFIYMPYWAFVAVVFAVALGRLYLYSEAPRKYRRNMEASVNIGNTPNTMIIRRGFEIWQTGGGNWNKTLDN